jgi:uncharacterized protein YndB with AHSA1/START domain
MNNIEFVAEPGQKKVKITMTFDAPRDSVFKAITDPELVPSWWGPREFSTNVDTMDVKPGGKWRYVQFDKDGNEYAFNGIYRQVLPPEKLVYTFEFEGMQGQIITETVVLEEQDGKTTVWVTDEFDAVEQRDGSIAAGMKEGAVESMERFGELLKPERPDR